MLTTLSFLTVVIRKFPVCDLTARPSIALALTVYPNTRSGLWIDISHRVVIGSEPVGKIIATTAAQNLTPLCIELGGKDAAILLPSTDIDTFASTFLRAAFQASGQNCIGIERFIVHESLVDRLVTLLKPRIEALRQGKDYGAMISTARFDELESIIGEAEKDGAKVLLGGKRGTGHYFQPTLVVGVKKDMRLAREEGERHRSTLSAKETARRMSAQAWTKLSGQVLSCLSARCNWEQPHIRLITISSASSLA